VQKSGNLSVGVAASGLLFNRHDAGQLDFRWRVLVQVIS
jgi:hypothetical protein